MICIGKGLHVSRSLRKAPCLRHVAAFVSPISITTGAPVTSGASLSLRLLKVNNNRTRKLFQQCHHFTHTIAKHPSKKKHLKK